jgi:hypothetical protein
MLSIYGPLTSLILFNLIVKMGLDDRASDLLIFRWYSVGPLLCLSPMLPVCRELDVFGGSWAFAACATYVLSIVVPVYGSYLFVGGTVGFPGLLVEFPWLSFVISVSLCAAWTPRAKRRVKREQ